MKHIKGKSMANLQVTIPENTQTILGVVTINAPLAAVFAAHTDREIFAKWWGRGNALDIKAFDAVSGGSYHVAEKDGEMVHEFCGSFHEVTPNQQIVWTFEYLGIPERGHVAMEILSFSAVDANTTEIRTTSVYPSLADRDQMLAYDMEKGWRMSIEVMEKVLLGRDGN